MNQLPQTPYDQIIAEAGKRGQLYRERGGTFRTLQAVRDGSTIRYYKVLYPPAQYSADGVLIPQEPEITNELVGIEKIATPSEVSISHEPSEPLPQHELQEQDLRRPVLA